MRGVSLQKIALDKGSATLEIRVVGVKFSFGFHNQACVNGVGNLVAVEEKLVPAFAELLERRARECVTVGREK